MTPAIIVCGIASLLLFISYRKDGKEHLSAKIVNAVCLLLLTLTNTYQANMGIRYLRHLDALLKRYENQHWGQMLTNTYLIFLIVAGIVSVITIPFLLLMAYRIDKGRQFYLGILIVIILPSNTFMTCYLLMYAPLQNVITAWLFLILNYVFIFVLIVVYTKPFMKALFRPQKTTQLQPTATTFDTHDILDA